MELTAYTILFIDDHCSAYLPSLEPAANVAGFSIHPIDNVLEGLEYLKEYSGTVHAVILDLSFPKGEMQGAEALQKIKKSHPSLPVIMLTDSDTAADIDRVVDCMKKGAYNYVGKRTLNPVYLFQVATAAIQQSRLLAQAQKRTEVSAANGEQFFTFRQSGTYGRFKQSAIFGFELTSVNKPADEKEESYLKNSAVEWHTNLLRAISVIYLDEVQVNLKYICEKGELKCFILVTLYAMDEIALELIIRNVQHDLTPFFAGEYEKANQPYLFTAITDTDFLREANQLGAGYKYSLFYRKPVKMSTEGGIGFGSSLAKQEASTEYQPDELFPFIQNLNYDNELFKALQNQKDYTEIDVLLMPKHLLKQEIDFIKQSVKNINALDVKTKNHEVLRLYADYLQQFLVNVKDKFLVSVICKRKSKNWERHLNTAIGNFFFGLDADYSYRHAKQPEELHRFCTSEKGIPNQLPFFYDLQAAVQSFRLPFPTVMAIPGIKVQPHIFHSLPDNLPATGILLGEKAGINGRQEVRMAPEALARHLYIMGQTGTGKSTLLKTMIADCLKNNEGFAVIDPHGDLFEEVQKLIPKSKKKKLFILDPLNAEKSATMNPLQYNEDMPGEKSLVINELIRAFSSLYDMKEAGGPMFETYFKNGLLLLMDEGVQKNLGVYALSDLIKIFQNTDFRNLLLKDCESETVKNFFKTALAATGEQAFANYALYVTSKLTRFVEDHYLSPLITGKKKNIDFRRIMDEGNILLVKMDKGLIGTDNTTLLGQMVLGNIIRAAMSRSGTTIDERKPYNILIDEFQNFIKSDAGTALSEVRKYGLRLILANQTLGQLDDYTIQSLMGNVGSLNFFRPGINDYEKVKHFLEPEFKREDVLKLPNFNCIARLLIDNVPSEPFVFQTKTELQ